MSAGAGWSRPSKGSWQPSEAGHEAISDGSAQGGFCAGNREPSKDGDSRPRGSWRVTGRSEERGDAGAWKRAFECGWDAGALGTAASFAVARAITSMLFGTQPSDP